MAIPFGQQRHRDDSLVYLKNAVTADIHDLLFNTNTFNHNHLLHCDKAIATGNRSILHQLCHELRVNMTDFFQVNMNNTYSTVVPLVADQYTINNASNGTLRANKKTYVNVI